MNRPHEFVIIRESVKKVNNKKSIVTIKSPAVLDLDDIKAIMPSITKNSTLSRTRTVINHQVYGDLIVEGDYRNIQSLEAPFKQATIGYINYENI